MSDDVTAHEMAADRHGNMATWHAELSRIVARQRADAEKVRELKSQIRKTQALLYRYYRVETESE